MPNSDVRANTVELFLDAFPFSDPALSAMDADALIQKQFDFMHVSDNQCLYSLCHLQNLTSTDYTIY